MRHCLTHLVRKENKAKTAHPKATRSFVLGRSLETSAYLLDLRFIRRELLFTILGDCYAGLGDQLPEAIHLNN